MLRFAIPSKESGYEKSSDLLKRCGLRISRPNPRQYSGVLRGIPNTEIHFHRPIEILQKVADGSLDVGITGLDYVLEHADDNEQVLLLVEDLGFWHVKFVIAAPQAWIDVHTWEDLAEVAADFHAQNRALRIATKYPNIARRFCYEHGINAFRLVYSAGSTEAAPLRGYSDIILDITETGSTIRENHLKVVGGPIGQSQACLIANKANLQRDESRRERVGQILDLLEAEQNGRDSYSLVANLPGESVEQIGQQVTALPHAAGLQGPTISPVWSKVPTPSDAPMPPSWYAVNVIVSQAGVREAVAHLRQLGASTVSVTPVQYTFYAESQSYARLMTMLEPVSGKGGA
jgi:ATP phosphoribosyltransferase